MARVAKVSNNICGEPNYFCSPFVQSKPTWLVLRRSHLQHTHTHKSASFIWPEKLNEACMWTHISRFSSQIASLGSVSPPLRLYYKWPAWRPQPHTHILALSSLKRASLRLCYKWPAWWPQPHLCPALPKEGHTEALLQRASLRPHGHIWVLSSLKRATLRLYYKGPACGHMWVLSSLKRATLTEADMNHWQRHGKDTAKTW